MSSRRFDNTEPPRTTVMTGDRPRPTGVSSGRFDNTEPPRTTIMKGEPGLNIEYNKTHQFSDLDQWICPITWTTEIFFGVQVHGSRSCYWKGPLVKDGYWTGSTGPLVLDDGPLDHGTLEYTLQFSLDRPPSPVQWTISILC